MSKAELGRLEREVEEARLRVTSDLGRLKGPGAFAELKESLVSEATDAKNQVIEKSKEAVRDGAQSVLSEIQARVAANPIAALTVGAGLAWWFIRKPPITPVLLGLGLYGLARTNAAQPMLGAQTAARAVRMAGDAKSKLERMHPMATASQIGNAAVEMGSAVAERATELGADAQETAGQVAEAVVDAAKSAGRQGQRTAKRVAGGAKSLAKQGRRAVGHAVPESDRDKALFGAAALAIAAAIGVAAQRANRPAQIERRR